MWCEEVAPTFRYYNFFRCGDDHPFAALLDFKKAVIPVKFYFEEGFIVFSPDSSLLNLHLANAKVLADAVEMKLHHKT